MKQFLIFITHQGLANVISLDWLRMFSNHEVQVLISGAEVPVDIEDLKKHTNYVGGYSPDDPAINLFWSVVNDFTDEQKTKLLKFVTSCSRPPLLGFKVYLKIILFIDDVKIKLFIGIISTILYSKSEFFRSITDCKYLYESSKNASVQRL